MEITQERYERIESYLPRQRGNVSMSNLNLINAILYVAENGCKWRALPRPYGNWHTIYAHMNRWSKNGVLQRGFEALQREEGVIRVRVEAVCLDSTSVKVHPSEMDALKNGRQSVGRSRSRLTTKIHMAAATDRSALKFSLSGEAAHDTPRGIEPPDGTERARAEARPDGRTRPMRTRTSGTRRSRGTLPGGALEVEPKEAVEVR